MSSSTAENSHHIKEEESESQETERRSENTLTNEVAKMSIADRCKDGKILDDELQPEGGSDGEESDESSSEDDEEDGWITPNNIAEVIN